MIEITKILASIGTVCFFIFLIWQETNEESIIQIILTSQITSKTPFRTVKDGFGYYYLQYKVFGLWFYWKESKEMFSNKMQYSSDIQAKSAAEELRKQAQESQNYKIKSFKNL